MKELEREVMFKGNEIQISYKSQVRLCCHWIDGGWDLNDWVVQD